MVYGSLFICQSFLCFSLLLLGFIAFMRYNIYVFRIFSRAYIEFFRGIPLFVFIIWLYYGLAMVQALILTDYCWYYLFIYATWRIFTEIYRSGIEAIPKGQWEASYSLGFSTVRAFYEIIFPQVLKLWYLQRQICL